MLNLKCETFPVLKHSQIFDLLKGIVQYLRDLCIEHECRYEQCFVPLRKIAQHLW